MEFCSGFLARDSTQQRRCIGKLFLALTIGFGFAQVWACRFELNPDSLDYLDIAREMSSGHWAAIANGYWGTLDSALLAPLFRFHLTPENELLLAHLEGIIILIWAFFSFQFFLNSVLDTISDPRDRAHTELRSLPEWALCVLGYSTFLWSSLIMVSVVLIGPDLLVTAFVYLAAGMLMRLRQEIRPTRFVAFGLTLGVGYWVKGVMFPISIVFLSVLIVKSPRWKQNFCSVAAFVAVAAPLLIALSVPRGRFTFGDSGRLNYSSMVSPGGRLINWQGDPIASGVPNHPTRKIAVNPPIYEFNGPIPGTYPPSYDPSYWNEGRRATFDFREQLKVIAHHVPPVVDLFFASQPSLTAGFLFLIFCNSGGFLGALAQRWDLVAISMAIVGLYMLVHFETRFVGAFLVLIWLSLFSSLRLPANKNAQRTAGLSIVALALAMLLSFASNVAKKVVNGCPESAQSQLEVARRLGLPRGTPVAVVGPGNYSYWAHFAQLRIVADIMSSDEFWQLPEEKRQEFYADFQKTGALWIIAQPPILARARFLDVHWKQIGTTTYYCYSLRP